MKEFRIYILVVITGGLFAFNSCKYDVTEPLWDKSYDEPPIPQITSIEPAAAIPGVNFITIKGTGFSTVHSVYFNTTQTEIVSTSNSEVVVRRPGLIGDSLEVKILPNETLVAAKQAPYDVDRIAFEFGSYDELIAVIEDTVEFEFCVPDNNDNIYTLRYNGNENRRYLDKITTAGERTELNVSIRQQGIKSIVKGPDGRWYIFYDSNRRYIDALDLQNETLEESWVRLGGGEFPKTGAFDNEGYFYTGGDGTSLQVVDPSLNISQTTYYSEDDLIDIIRVYQNTLYLLVQAAVPDAETPEWAIWKHDLLGSGGVSDRQLLIDLNQNPLLVGKEILNMEVSAEGNIFISTDGANSLLEYDVTSGTMDYYYKNILPSTIKSFKWGSTNSIYAIVKDATYNDPDYGVVAERLKNRLVRIDLGVAGN